MLGFDITVLAFACCGWLTAPLEFMTSPQRPLSAEAMQPMKGRVVAIEAGPAFSEAGMDDPANRIAGLLAMSLANRYGLRVERGASGSDALSLGVQTLEWRVEPAWKDYQLRYRGEATLVDRQSGRRLGRAWCDRSVTTGKNSYDEALADRPALATALSAAADSCLQQFREALVAEVIPR